MVTCYPITWVFKVERATMESQGNERDYERHKINTSIQMRYSWKLNKLDLYRMVQRSSFSLRELEIHQSESFQDA